MTSSPSPSDTGAPADDAPDAAAAVPAGSDAATAAAATTTDASTTAADRGAVEEPVAEVATSGAVGPGVPAGDPSTEDDAAPAAAAGGGRVSRSAVPTAPPSAAAPTPRATTTGSAAPRDPGATGAAGAPGAEGAEGEDVAPADGSRVTRLEEEGEVAADYLEELLDIVDLDGDIDIDVADARAVVSVVGEDDGGSAALRTLAGPHGEVLEALQELTRLAVQTRTGERSRLMLDVAGYRAERREQLLVIAGEALRRVEEEGAPVALDPMNPFERKVVHDAVAAAGLVSDSDGVEPQRRVVIHPRQG